MMDRSDLRRSVSASFVVVELQELKIDQNRYSEVEIEIERRRP